VDKNIYDELLPHIEEMKVIDTHEHTYPESQRQSIDLDVFNLFEQYIFFDCISSGLSYEKMRKFVDDKTVSIKERWNEFSNYWEKAKNTTYGEVILIAVKDLLGFGDLNDETYMPISKKLSEVNTKGWYKKVLKDLCHIEKCVLNLDLPSLFEQVNVDRDLFVPVARFDYYLNFTKRSTIELIEKDSNISIHNITQLLKAFDHLFSIALESKVCAVKIALAYERTINIGRPLKSEAEAELSFLLDETLVNIPWLQEKAVSLSKVKQLQDFFIRYILDFAEANDIPVQIHTGLQEGHGNYVVNSYPLLIANLLLEYKKLRFAIFHGGYPFMREVISLAKNFQNAYLDMCWLHIISRKAAKDFLEEAIEAVPLNKIFGFGGDFEYVEGTYGHIKIAKQNISMVLAKLIEEERIDKKTALKIARILLYENPSDFYKVT
jgi:hypothetical protein